MKIRLVAVGKIKDRPTRALVDDYLGRLSHYCACEEIEIVGKRKDALARFTKATKGATVVALDVVGVSFSSRDLARKVEAWSRRGKGIMAFCVGGADGLPKALLDNADVRWSLSDLTFPPSHRARAAGRAALSRDDDLAR